jgi:DNA-binding transcriptional regulator YdaS (Cro superfamily)
METLATLILLIEKAGAISGSEYKLAQTLGVPQQVLSDWKAGRRTCTPPDRARLAAMAQEDAVQELVRATIQSTEGTLRGEQLATVLGKWLRATGEVKGSVWLGLTSLIYGTASTGASLDVLRCILC